MKTTGIVLIVVGVLLTIFTGFGFFTEKEVADIGNLEITKQEKQDVNWSPYLGVGLIVIGGIMLIARSRRA